MGFFLGPGGSSGVYTPSIAETLNIDSISSPSGRFIRIGKVVIVTGQVAIDPTTGAPTASTIGISLPVPSDISAAGSLSGSAVGSTGVVGRIFGNAGADEAQLDWDADHTDAVVYDFSFSYEIE